MGRVQRQIIQFSAKATCSKDQAVSSSNLPVIEPAIIIGLIVGTIIPNISNYSPNSEPSIHQTNY
jgi:hypothetical protein